MYYSSKTYIRKHTCTVIFFCCCKMLNFFLCLAWLYSNCKHVQTSTSKSQELGKAQLPTQRFFKHYIEYEGQYWKTATMLNVISRQNQSGKPNEYSESEAIKCNFSQTKKYQRSQSAGLGQPQLQKKKQQYIQEAVVNRDRNIIVPRQG